MGPREVEVRSRLARDRDIMRGLGQEIGLADAQSYLDELNYAALADSRIGFSGCGCGGPPCVIPGARSNCPHQST